MNTPQNPAHKENGFVLVIVLWIVAVLSVVSLGIGRQAWLDRQAAAYALDHAQAPMMARGAVNRGAVELRNKLLKDLVSSQQLGLYTAPVTHWGQEWAKSSNLFLEGEYFLEGGEEFKNDIVEFRISDLQSKFNINTIPLAFMEKIEGLDRSVIRKIEFRRTGDPERGTLPMLFNTIEELRYFEGIKDEDWFGDGKTPGLQQILSVWGDEKINLNTALPQTLGIIPGLESRSIGEIMDFRAGDDGELYTADDQGFLNFDELWRHVPIDEGKREALMNLTKLDSSFFEIIGIASRRGGKVRAKVSAVVDMQLLYGVQFRDPAIQIPPSPFVRWREEIIGS